MHNNFLLICAVILFSCASKPTETGLKNKSRPIIGKECHDTLSRFERAKILKNYLSKFPDNIAQEKFYYYFPNSFDEFKSIFGYYEVSMSGADFGPLYDESQKYIDAFFNIKNISPSKITKRAINIAKEGHWQADGINIFQLYLQEDLTNNLTRYIEELKMEREDIINSFWYFYFDGPNPENYKKDYELLYQKVKKIDTEIAELMKQAYEKVLSEHDGHGH